MLELAHFRLIRRIMRRKPLAGLLFSLSTTEHLLRLLYGLSAFGLTWSIHLLSAPTEPLAHWIWLAILFTLLIFLSLIIGDFVPRAFAVAHPKRALRYWAPIATLYLLITLPLTSLSPKRFTERYVEKIQAPITEVKEKIIEMLDEAEVKSATDANEKRLVESVLTFRDRIVREVMIPRVDIDAIPSTATLKEAAELFSTEQHSRLPVYEESIDKVTGMLLYKDVMRLDQPLEGPITGLLKPMIYVPETARVTQLLQEFRSKQTHLAVVVDEYGGTEGLVTMEDCLEEIVGEISDEYDEAAPSLFQKQRGGSYIVDARMPIHEIEEEFEIEIPREGEYDTIGGFAFYRAGEIPQRGLVIHADTFDLEILEVSQRSIERVRIKPL